MEVEIWKDIKEYEGIYQVSNIGRIKSFINHRGVIERQMKLCESGKRLIVGLRKNGKKKSKFVHQLVLIAFKSDKPKGLVCRHIDGNFRNNHIDNLAWGTYSENMQDAIKHGNRGFNKGEKHGQAKLTVSCVKEIKKKILEGEPSKRLAKQFNVCKTTVVNIKYGRVWSHVNI